MKRAFAITALALAAPAFAPAQTITVQPTNQVVTLGGRAAFVVAVSGAGPFRYQWQFDGMNLPNNVISTVAGTASAGFSGDGGPATNARLAQPVAVVVDGAGNVFISDNAYNRVRKVDTNGIITTVAGVATNAGTRSYSGDGGPATNANLWSPGGLAVDGAGNLFIADASNQRIRKVDTNGIIMTVAGNGINYDSSGYSGAATNASLSQPIAVALDGLGNLFIANAGNNVICKVDTRGFITTVVGNGSGTYSGDGTAATNTGLNFNYGSSVVAVDGFGNLFIADTSNQCVRKGNTNGIITTVAGNGIEHFSGDGGPATNASFVYPGSVTVDRSGNLFIADWGDNRIREVDTNGIITTVAGDGPSFASGSYSGDGGPAINASLDFPSATAFDGAGNLFIADQYNSRIRMVAFGGSPTLAFSSVSASNAGNYRVIVTGQSGSVTSSVAALTVYGPPVISKVVRNADGSVTLTCSSAPNSVNLVQAISLSSPFFWENIGLRVAAADGTWQFTDQNAGLFATRFYRTKEQ